ncbi:zinc finger C2HC domain-containing protein 1C-like [Erpetoichthys calabaricus]|uniref:zinc finger C2HC domain-containing protein 1C-like n=1 Tax=Erpetoichthys calabaricus TaxID=27687 RepID=UPI0010A0AF89|nr:zinc finger C2HC domain-containing protein 1C-like [Erpetoichthys calabaricus]
MAHLRTTSYPYAGSRPPYHKNIQPSQFLSMGQNGWQISKPQYVHYQESPLQEKERKMLALYDRQQQAALSRVRNTFGHQNLSPDYKMVNNQQTGVLHRGYSSAGSQFRYNHAEHIKYSPTPISTSKKTAGVDRAYPLKPVYYKKAACLNHTFNQKGGKFGEAARKSSFMPSASAESSESSNMSAARSHLAVCNQDDQSPAASQYGAYRGGPTKSEMVREQQRYAEEMEQVLEEKIQRDKALLYEKLWRSQNNVRRNQREEQERKEIKERTQRKRCQARYFDDSLLEESKPEWRYEYQGSFKSHGGGGGGVGDQYRQGSNIRKIHEQHWRETNPEYVSSEVDYNKYLTTYNEIAEKMQNASCGKKSNELNKPLLNYSPYVIHQKQDSQAADLAMTENARYVKGDQAYDYESKSSYVEYEKAADAAKEMEGELVSGDRQRVACPYCNRKFDAHRVEKHENVCVKLFNTKRKLFDSFKYRIQGTDIEKFNKQQKTFPTVPQPEKHWRQKHENLVNTLRESRKTQKLLLKDGKSSKAPQVPSKDNPESSRKYSSFAAERHIPKSESVKSRPPPPPKKKNIKRN